MRLQDNLSYTYTGIKCKNIIQIKPSTQWSRNDYHDHKEDYPEMFSHNIFKILYTIPYSQLITVK